jgi:GNAT superfamily N-acetyltransferase
MIRYLTLKDHALLRAIRMEALATDADAFGATLAATSSRSDSAWLEWLAQVMVPNRKNIIAIELREVPVAMCGFGLSDDNDNGGFIWGMFVSLSERRNGHGRAMLKEAEQWIGAQGRQIVKAQVAAPNQSAIQFYRQAGYSVGPVVGFLRSGSSIPVHPIEKRISV